MRSDPQRLGFEIAAGDGDARSGRLLTAHGPISTPAFVPLATRGSVRSLTSAEVAGLGYEQVLGNTFHLFLAPGPGASPRSAGCTRSWAGSGAIITDSGGFQVFSLAHGSVADEVKGRRGSAESSGSVLSISEDGVRFRSYIDGSERFLGPEESMRVQADLGSDIALAFDECTPFHADREYTARSTERTHRWLDRCLAWHEREGPRRQALFGIVQGGVHADLRRESAERVSAADVDGIAIGGTLGRDKPEMYAVLDLTVPHLPLEAPKHLLGIGEPDDLLEGIAPGHRPLRLRRADAAGAPRDGAGPARRRARFRFDVRRAAHATDAGPLVESCPCACCEAHSRAYLHYLCRQRELTAVHLLSLHNLTFLERLVSGAREAIAGGRFAAYRESILAGAAPWDA